MIDTAEVTRRGLHFVYPRGAASFRVCLFDFRSRGTHIRKSPSLVTTMESLRRQHPFIPNLPRHFFFPRSLPSRDERMCAGRWEKLILFWVPLIGSAREWARFCTFGAMYQGVQCWVRSCCAHMRASLSWIMKMAREKSDTGRLTFVDSEMQFDRDIFVST